MTCLTGQFSSVLGDLAAGELGGPLLAGLALLSGLLLVVALYALRARARVREETRVLVQTLEALRSGRGRGTATIEDTTELTLVADAVQRLAADLRDSWSEAEAAAERWRAVSDATRDTAIITTDTDGDVRSFSAGAARLTGWDEDEVLARPAAVLFEENAYRDLLPKLTRRSLRTQGVTTRATLVRRDGSTLEAEVAVRMLATSSGQPVGFMLLVRDITEQIRIETELRDSERRYRGLVERLSEGVIIVREGRIVHANPAAEALCGRPGPELAGLPWRDQVATRDVLVVETTLGALARGQSGGASFDCTLVGPDGIERAEVRIKAAAVEFAGGAAVMLLVRDETAERRAADVLRRNEARLDAVLEAAADGLLVLSEDRTRLVQMTNRVFAEMLGLRVEELLGASEARLAELLAGAGPGGARLWRRITEGTHDAAPVVVERAGRVRELAVHEARLAGRAGESLGQLVVCRDVTEQRRAERDLQAQAENLALGKLELEQAYRKLSEVHRELESRSRELDRVNQELQQLDKMKSELIGNVSHELQTPLVSIRGYTEMILKERLGPINEEQRKGLVLSLKSIDRLIAMIDNLQALSRTDAGQSELRATQFPLRPLIEEVLGLLRPRIEQKSLRVVLDVQEPHATLEADRDQIFQVFLNLLSNGVKFSHASGQITITVGPGGPERARVTVRDEGVGIPPEALGRIFERHFQARPAAAMERPAGSGIGLAIVRDILRLHGCTIEVASEEGRGTSFAFTLPLAPGTGTTSEPLRADLEPAQGASAETPSPQVAAPPPRADEVPRAPDEVVLPGGTPTSRTLRPRLRIIRRPQ